MLAQKGDILTQPPSRLGALRRCALGAALLVVPALGVVGALGLVPQAVILDEQALALVRQSVSLPEPSSAASATQHYVTQERVLRGDTVAALFERRGVHDPRAINFLKADASGRALFRQLVPGRTLQAETGDEGELIRLRYFVNSSELLEVSRQSDGFQAKHRAITEAARLIYKTATIRSSLFAATDAAGIPDVIAMQVARVFATDIDFHSDLRKGDRFSVVYEMLYDSGELVAPGRILAAQFVNDRHEYNAVLFQDNEGNDAYYSLDGTNRAKAFLRSPVEFSRVSSAFGARFHPIFKNWRAHTGVDFAAPQGTRVLAAADGHIVSAGARGGYGNAVEIRHGGGIATLYAHLSGFARGIRAGARVKQGEPIGFVGRTGWATGAHLHYEFKVAGVHQDPLRVALPKAEPVPARLKSQFLLNASHARSTIDLLNAGAPAGFE